MELTSTQLLQDLRITTENNLQLVENFKKESIETLNWRENAKSWSILECIEHLNRYGDFYIPEINKRIEASNYQSSKVFKSNWLGRYFSNAVSYKENLNTMKTFKSMNPLHSKLNKKTLEKFIDQQHQIIDILEQSKEINLDKTKTAISISKLIKLKLGDTFRVLIYHNERHVAQAKKVLRNCHV
ncbi:DinB family protein [Tenacibaculum agarivorans]|uniref:DinB family protein n=1 Tax=Tenacibaculum agarivorans TaxID=1908389 RepID=UPI00094B904C|nr:DinB family protein [Tenacibaculum agarivorans]